MRKKLWICLALLLVIPGFLFTVSCAKKTVKSDTDVTKASEEESVEAAKKRAIEEERLREEEAQRRIIAARNEFLNEDIYFEFDRYDLIPSAQDVLRKKAAWLRSNSGVSVFIEGHCDERGTNEYNLALGDRRAESAKSFLLNLGIASSRLTTISYGEEQPVDPGHNEEAWEKNRRAHFVIE